MKFLICLIALLAASMAQTVSPATAVFVSNSVWVSSHQTCRALCVTEFTTLWKALEVGDGKVYDAQTDKDAGRDEIGAVFIGYDGKSFEGYVAVTETPQTNMVSGTMKQEILVECKYLDDIPGDNKTEYKAAWTNCLNKAFDNDGNSMPDNFSMGSGQTSDSLKIQGLRFSTAETPLLDKAFDLTIYECFERCTQGKFDWKTNEDKTSYAQQETDYLVAYETKEKCEKDCNQEKGSLYTNYEQRMSKFWGDVHQKCMNKYTSSGPIKENASEYEDLDTEGKSLENTNACLIYRGAKDIPSYNNQFMDDDYWSSDFYASMMSCSNFCTESTMVGTGDRTNALLDAVLECKGMCRDTFETTMVFEGDVETKFEGSFSSILSVTLALLALVALLF